MMQTESDTSRERRMALLSSGSDVRMWGALTGGGGVGRIIDVGFDPCTWEIVALRIRRCTLFGRRATVAYGPFHILTKGFRISRRFLPGLWQVQTRRPMILAPLSAVRVAAFRWLPRFTGVSANLFSLARDPQIARNRIRWMDDLSRYCVQSFTGVLGLIDDFILDMDALALSAIVIEHLTGSPGHKSLVFPTQVKEIDKRQRKIWFRSRTGALPHCTDLNQPGDPELREEGLRAATAGLGWSREAAGETEGRTAGSRRVRLTARRGAQPVER